MNETHLVYQDQLFRNAKATDRSFAYLMLLQWFAGVAIAFYMSPRSWAGSESFFHVHVYAAFFLGGLIALLPVYLGFNHAGDAKNKFIIAAAQMCFSSLLVHLTGGRIETHFHVFGSLAFLSFYKDYRVILLATVVTALDHLVRGLFWPETFYGVLNTSILRTLEHSAWVIFEDIFLLIGIRKSLEDLKNLADKQSRLEFALSNVEKLVEERTSELVASKESLMQNQLVLASSAKLAALGEMAGGVAHEINTPLSVISMKVEQLQGQIKHNGQIKPEFLEKSLEIIRNTTARIANIVSGLRMIARDGSRTAIENVNVNKMIEDTLSFCRERFKNSNVRIDFNPAESTGFEVECRFVEVSQVILNLLNNAYDATNELDDKWVQIHVASKGGDVEISVLDSGSGVPLSVQEKIMTPFFTTKSIGKGTGLGLSISKDIIESHNGKLFIDNKSSNTKFTIRLPKVQIQIKAA